MSGHTHTVRCCFVCVSPHLLHPPHPQSLTPNQHIDVFEALDPMAEEVMCLGDGAGDFSYGGTFIVATQHFWRRCPGSAERQDFC